MNSDLAECQTLTDLRAVIDGVDRDLVALLARRAACIDRAIELKRLEGQPARIGERVEEVVAQARAAAEEAGLDPGAIEALWRCMIEWSIAREERVLGREETA